MKDENQAEAITGSSDEEEDEDIVDPHETLKDECRVTPACSKLKDILDTCTEEVNKKNDGTVTCTVELYDFVHCVDHCAAKTLFSKLK